MTTSAKTPCGRARPAARTRLYASLLLAGLSLNAPAQQYFQAQGANDGSDNASAAAARATAAGSGANASAADATAVGSGSEASGARSTTVGAGSAAVADDTASFGYGSFAGEARSLAVGANANALGVAATAVGESALANGVGSTAIGRFSRASRDNSVALGANSVADRDNAVSVGSSVAGTDSGGRAVAPFQRQIINLADGIVADASKDAINGGQLYALAQSAMSAIGGGAVLRANGGFTGPSFVVQGNSYASVFEALQAVDGGLTGFGTALADVRTQIAGIVSQPTPTPTPTPAPTPAPAAGQDLIAADGARDGSDAAQVQAGAKSVAIGARANASAQNSVALGAGSIADRANTVSVGSPGNERQVANVADGTAGTDAVNLRQLNAANERMLSQANSYTDQAVQSALKSVDDMGQRLQRRIDGVDQRVDRMGAMNSAMTNMAVSAAGLRTQNRFGAGYGYSGGEQALSIGYQRAVSERITVTVSGAFSGSENSVGTGIGIGW